MSLRVVILALFFILTLLPQGWNKFDNTPHAILIYLIAPLLTALLILGWKKLAISRLDRERKFSPQNIAKITAILLAILFGVAFMFSPVKSFGWSEVVVMATGVSIFFLLQDWRDGEQKTLLTIITVVALLASFFGLFQYLVRPESRIAGPFFVKAITAHYWPNAFALFLLSAWPLTLFCKFEPVNLIPVSLIKKCINLFLPVIPIAALLLTFSRAAFLVFLLQLSLLAWFSRKKLLTRECAKNTAISIVFVLILVSGLHLVRQEINTNTTNSIVTKATFSGTEKQTSFSERYDFMRGAITLISQAPLIGTGPFTFRYIYPQIQKDFLAVSDHPHNWYLKTALEEGIPSLAIMILFLGCILYTRRDVFQNPSADKWSKIIFIGLLGPLLHNLADYNMNFLTNQLLFWTMLAFFFTPKKNADTDIKQSPTVTPLAIIVATGIFTLSGFIGIEGYNALTKEYDKLLFSRNYHLEEARYLQETNEPEKAVVKAMQAISRNPYDAFSWNFYGHLLEEKKEPKALQAYENALRSDPANFFNFYNDYFRFAKKLQLTDTSSYKKYESLALKFLEAYPEKVRSNVHYTAQTGNVEHAITLAKLLNKPQLALRIRRALRTYQTASKTRN